MRNAVNAGFLPDLCREWETATQAAIIRGIRVVIPRVGIVLSSRGGAMARMLPFFRLGLGGRIGSGRQYMSWIALEDLLRTIHHAILTPSLHGPVNAVSPNPVTNKDFSKALGRALSRPTRFALPAFAARIALGRWRTRPCAMHKSDACSAGAIGVYVSVPELEGALRHLFQNTRFDLTFHDDRRQVHQMPDSV
jgi:uncharacterized protein (TIGR01777 family)